jgi:antitoxin (DNA-binding transcriptional repressor) of toxin-antitoxin stability system
MAVIHISEAEAAHDFSKVASRVCAGEDIVIDLASAPVGVRLTPFPRRTISETIALAEESAKRLGYEPVMDEDFAADMREIIANRKPADRSAWD